MFSLNEKKIIAEGVEKLLLNLNHPEMPKQRPIFDLHVAGKESWSWADIKPNWIYENKEPSISDWMERQRR